MTNQFALPYKVARPSSAATKVVALESCKKHWSNSATNSLILQNQQDDLTAILAKKPLQLLKNFKELSPVSRQMAKPGQQPSQP